MSKRKTGRDITQGVYRDLEKLYGVKIEKNGDFEPLTDGHLSISLWNKVRDAVQAVKNSVENLPEPARPVGRNARNKTWHAKPGPKENAPVVH